MKESKKRRSNNSNREIGQNEGKNQNRRAKQGRERRSEKIK
jgi:hypothetical protein